MGRRGVLTKTLAGPGGTLEGDTNAVRRIMTEAMKRKTVPDGGKLLWPQDETRRASLQREKSRLQKDTTDRHAEIKATRKERWQVNWADVKAMWNYIKRCHKDKVSPGPDLLTGSVMVAGGTEMMTLLAHALEVIAYAGNFPKAWCTAILVPVLKPGKRRQDAAGYRPITMTSILAKAMEAAIKRRFEEAMSKDGQGLNKYTMAYKKGQGADLAILMCVETVLLAQNSARGPSEPRPKIWGISVDIKDAFNGTWREFVEVEEWQKHGVRSTVWEAARQISGNISYQLRMHGHLVSRFKQSKGMAQGPVLSPMKYNVSWTDA